MLRCSLELNPRKRRITGILALEVSGADPRKDAVTRDIQPESQNCGWSGV
jgi:hypothetical protein